MSEPNAWSESYIRSIVRDEISRQEAERDQDRLLTVTEAAALLGVTTHAVRKAEERGRLPSVRVGSAVRFRASDLKAVSRGR